MNLCPKVEEGLGDLWLLRVSLTIESQQPSPSLLHCPPESVRYRLPILGPRTAVFHGLLSQTYRALQKTQLPPSPGKEPAGKVTSLRVMRAQHS